MLTTKIKYTFFSLVVFNIILLFGGCISDSDGNRCQDGKEFKDFEVLVDSFYALSSKQDCYRPQEAATKLLLNSKGCADELEIKASASPWLSFSCGDWTDF